MKDEGCGGWERIHVRECEGSHGNQRNKEERILKMLQGVGWRVPCVQRIQEQERKKDTKAKI